MLPLRALLLSLLLAGFFANTVLGQGFAVSGRVTDAESGEGLPFVNVYLTDSQLGASTDFDGYFEFSVPSSQAADSIMASFSGYVTRTKALTGRENQTVNFQLVPSTMTLDEVVVLAGENPAHAIMDSVWQNKRLHDKRQLEAYEFESYTKLEFSIDNISDALRERRVFKKIERVLDSADVVAGEDGKPIVPVFISETLSNNYIRRNPDLTKEVIQRTKVRGVGISDGSTISQLTGSTFQDYNFYRNWLNILEKEFASPLHSRGLVYYDYFLMETVLIDGVECYQIEFYPNQEQDLVFVGTLWVTTDSYALRQIDATIPPEANLNYIEKIKIQQELQPTSAGPWVPSNTRVLLDVYELTDFSAGVLAKFYTSVRDVAVTEPRKPGFYVPEIMMEEVAMLEEPGFWEEHRHERLSQAELNVYSMIDTLNSVPVIRNYSAIAELLVGGYQEVGSIDLGPYLGLYANNSIEGNRFYLGGKTNDRFARNTTLSWALGYGTLDERWKYRLGIDQILSRRRWTQVGGSFMYDIDQVGLFADELTEENYIFYTFTRWGGLRRPYYHSVGKAYISRDLFKGLQQTVAFRWEDFNPAYDFRYFLDPDNPDTSPVGRRFQVSEVVFETRYARDETRIQADNRRITLSQGRWPIFTFRYTLGLPGVLGSDFNYHKLGFSMDHKLNLGFFGVSRYELAAGRVLNALPYPLLEVHIGNETFFYTDIAYNTMNFFEFVSDTYASLRYQHHFEGFLLNRIPLVRRLRWRTVASANVLWGSVRDENQNLIQETDELGNPLPGFSALGSTPFIEVGYGVENVFRFGRIDFFHRLNYLERPGVAVSPFQVKISLQLIL